MNLSDNEKRDLVKLIEANKPLPDKFRFKLFGDKREVELVWNGKSREVSSVVLPFQTIEQVDEPRAEKRAGDGTAEPQQGYLFDERGRQQAGWVNKLIWGDNKLALASLKGGPLREEIEQAGGLKLIYIDPPFDVGADFSMDIEIGGGDDGGAETFTKKPNVLEQIAYSDTWGKGADSFIAMIYERLILMRDLLADDGSIYVHCDWRVNGYMRLVMDEIFGKENFINELIWQKIRSSKGQAKSFGNVHDSVFAYSKIREGHLFNKQYTEHDPKRLSSHYKLVDEKTGRQYQLADFTQRGQGEARYFGGKGLLPPPPGKHWIWSQEKINQGLQDGVIVFTNAGKPRVKRFLDDSQGQPVEDIWIDIYPINSQAKEQIGYPTQKPEKLVERIIKASSNEGDLVADFFCGSGTTAAVAEKLNRKWIVSDLGKFAIHTTRKRMIGVQRKLKAGGKDYRAFEILNLGKYERQHYIGVNPNLSDEQQQQQLQQKRRDYQRLILRAYAAQAVEQSGVFHGKKAGRMVAIGPTNLPVTRLFAEEVVGECLRRKITRADILAFEFEMGMFPKTQEDAKRKGVDLAPKYIPAEVFDKRAVDRGEIVFHDVSYIDAEVIKQKNKVAVRLTDFSVYSSQDAGREALANLKVGKSKVIAAAGQIVKITKEKNGAVSREILTKEWTDWIDYWAVDFDFERKPEVIRVRGDDGKIVEKESGDFVFENEWQSFRTRKNQTLELTSAFHECGPGARKLAVKMVDIFGNDTMRILWVEVE